MRPLDPIIQRRIEATAMLAAAIGAYAWLGFSWGVFAACFMLPDLSLLFYFAGPRVGGFVYNLAHFFLFPLILPAVLVLKLKERLFGLPEGLTNLSHEFKEPVNSVFAWIMGAERWMLRHIEFPRSDTHSSPSPSSADRLGTNAGGRALSCRSRRRRRGTAAASGSPRPT